MKYRSKFSGKKISENQYIAELLIRQRAYHLELELPDQFFKIPAWRGFYLAQLKQIKKLKQAISESDKLKINQSEIDSLIGRFLLKEIKSNKYWSLIPAWTKNNLYLEFIKDPYKHAEKSLDLVDFIEEPSFGKKQDIDLSQFDE